MFHPAESWHAENVNQFFAAVVSSVILLVCGIGLRSTEYSLIKNQAEQQWYEHSIFFTFFTILCITVFIKILLVCCCHYGD